MIFVISIKFWASFWWKSQQFPPCHVPRCCRPGTPERSTTLCASCWMSSSATGEKRNQLSFDSNAIVLGWLHPNSIGDQAGISSREGLLLKASDPCQHMLSTFISLQDTVSDTCVAAGLCHIVRWDPGSRSPENASLLNSLLCLVAVLMLLLGRCPLLWDPVSCMPTVTQIALSEQYRVR